MSSPSSVNPNSSNASLNQGLDFLGDLGNRALTGTWIPSAVLGYTGGWLTGVGTQMGLFQGVTSSLYHTVFQDRFVKYIAANTDKTSYQHDPNKISTSSAAFLHFATVVGAVALPIMATMYAGGPVMTTVSSKFETDGWVNRWILGPSASATPYSFILGVGVSVAPTAVQHFISYWRTEDKKTR